MHQGSNGVDDFLLFPYLISYRCVLDPGDKIVDCPPTFTMYEFDAAVNGALVIKGIELVSFCASLCFSLLFFFFFLKK